MFKKRALQIAVVKKNEKDETADKPENHFDENLDKVSEKVEEAIVKIGLLMFGFIVLDTVRQVVVNSTDK